MVADHERLLPKFLLKSFSVKAADFIAMSVLLMAARAREVDAGRAAKVNQVWNLLFYTDMIIGQIVLSLASEF